MKKYITIFIGSIILCIPSVFGQSKILSKCDFENGISPLTLGETTTPSKFKDYPGIRTTSLTGSSKAYGFGRAKDNINTCYSLLYIEYDEPVNVETISFKEMETNGNWGSNGLIYVAEDASSEPHQLNNADFGHMPKDDRKIDATYREKLIYVYQKVKYILFVVSEIADTSEILIDDLVITTNPPHGEDAYRNELETEKDISYFKSNYTITGTFSTNPYYANLPIFNNSYAFGFGQSTCTAYCYDNYKTSIKITLPEEKLIETVSFKAAELYTNWGSRGYLYLNGSQLANSAFHRFPDNDLTADLSYRNHEINAYRYAKDITFTVNDITDGSEIFIDDVVITSIHEDGDVILEENFEDNTLDSRITTSTKGKFIETPAVQQVDTFGIAKAYGFGKSECTSGCLNNYTSSLTINFPEKTNVFFISFKEFEIDGNMGSRGMIFIDDSLLYGGDFQRLPLNDSKSDTNYRHHAIPVFKEISKIEFKVWDITKTSEIFIADLVVKGVSSNPSSLKKEYRNNDVRIYPNPVTDKIFLNLLPEDLNSAITLYTANGGELTKIRASSTIMEIDMTNYNPGIYMIKIVTPNGRIFHEKILKQ